MPMSNRRQPMREEQLSARQVEILQLLAEGLSDRQIAEKLYLSMETVRWHNKQIYGKLGVSNRTQAAARAREVELLAKSRAMESHTIVPAEHSLPAQLTSFVGRERQMTEITQLLERERLVTLTGTGGSGKTRLALRVAAATAADYRDGAILVPLSSVSQPALVPNAIVHALGLTGPANPSVPETLRSYFSPRQMLLLLDNFEHLLAAVSLVGELLAYAPELTILATSRETLRLTGEHEYVVPPLALPAATSVNSASQLLDSEAGDLFVQRARTADTSFSVTDENAPAIAAICRRLDGLPLAIELAAARIKLFGPQQLLTRLDSRLDLLTGGPRDLPARQHTLRDTIDWSYHLLGQAEQRLFARLAVFQNGCSLEAVEAICGPELSRDSPDTLESLLHKSLLYKTRESTHTPRFFMLETIREYAGEELTNAGEAEALKERHLAFYLSLAESMESGFRQYNQLFLLDQTETELGNLRTAFEWAIHTGQIESAARLVSAIDYYFRYRDGTAEGYQWTRRIIPHLEELPPALQIRFLMAAARLSWQSGNAGEASSLARHGLALARREGDRQAEAWLLVESALAVPDGTGDREQYEAAIAYCEEALTRFREVDNRPGTAYALNVLGILLEATGDARRAREVCNASLAVCTETGEITRQSMVLSLLAFAASRQGEYERARALALTFLKQRLELGLKLSFIIGLPALAGPLSRLGQPHAAARLLGASAAMLEAMGMPYPPSDIDEVALYTSLVRAQLDEDAFAAASAEGQSMTLEQAIAYALGDQR
jgi:predicted ATPase/DNA-binding CsgD family transcriptional regulator